MLSDKETEIAGTGGKILTLTDQDDGTYFCIKCDQELYSSTHKKESKDWPLFSDSVDTGTIIKTDKDGIRDEVICSKCYSHLGHKLSNGKKIGHCINSYVLTFLPLDARQVRKYIGVLPFTIDNFGQVWLVLGQEHDVLDG